ncbi:activating signal cointegrator 1 complex subunit 2-like [Lolium rigidum]|uniref:activating signal cointegrator 1 complex subunit 2-like n=1 Tax=Lolium rigidum TaxID=89674 RepID=UPI001F5C31A1|nr:activating signal cointegrator 1 complex subunit 2-like [Lolium rigidum]
MSSAPPAQQSKPSYHRRHPNSGPRQQQQQRYVPKSAAPPAPKPSPPPSLTTALRSSAAPSASGADGFVAYLPHDEAVAAGLGGLDAQESQAVVDLLNDALAALLRAKPREFWRQVAQDTSLHAFLDSYLQFRHRWYDLPHRSPKGTVAGLVVGELELCRRVFMVLYRISSNKDPGTGVGESLSMKEHAALLQEKRLLDLPKLLDICAIYGHDNGKLTSSLVINAITVHPNVLDDINIVLRQFLDIFHTMQERCMKSLQDLSSPEPNDSGYTQLQKDFSEVLDFVNDAIISLDAFVDAYQPAALLLCTSFEAGDGVEELLNTLARLHDFLLPSLLQGFQVMSSSQSNGETSSDSIVTDIVLGIRMLSKRAVVFGWRLLEFCYLNDQLKEHHIQTSSTKMFPAKVEDPMIRGEIIIQKLKDINAEATYSSQVNPGKTFLQALQKDFQLISRIGDIRNKEWIYMEHEDFQFISRLCGSTVTSWNSVSDLPVSSHGGELQQKDEEAAVIESKISQIRDLLPHCGKGFLAVCLEAYNQNPEEVIQRILDGTLHQDLLALDTSLEEMPQQKHAPSVGKDKGKGILVESMPNITNKPYTLEAQSSSVSSASKAPTSSVALVSSSSKAPTSSVSSVPQGRFTRKSNDDLPDSTILDSRKAKDAVKSAVLESQYEYEDEYDDSFDDLGFSVVESSYEETDGANDVESSSSGPRWASQKKPQFYVKDGKNYSYKVTGSVAVSNAREAAVLNQTQKDTIHGLGRGGNVPMGVPNRHQHRVMEEEEGGHADGFSRGGSVPHVQGRRGGWDQSNPSEDNRNASAPRGGRGGRRGGRNHSNLAEANDGQQGFGRGARRDNRPEVNNHSDGQQGFGRGARRDNRPEVNNHSDGQQGFGHGARRGARDEDNRPEVNNHADGHQGFGRGARRGARDEDNRPEVNNRPNGEQGFGRGARRGGRIHEDPVEDNEDHNPAQGFARGGPGPRGGGGRRGGGRNHNRRDQALRKHMQGMTGL